MLELHHVSIGQPIKELSLTVNDGQMLTITGAEGCGKTTLLRALVGLIGIDQGHISIDGELLTPRSAPWFRRRMAYVPQYLSVPDGYDEVPVDYVLLLERAVASGKQMLIADEPSKPLDEERMERVVALLEKAQQQGMTVIAVVGHDVAYRLQGAVRCEL